jgi:uncharacterized protein YvpB
VLADLMAQDQKKTEAKSKAAKTDSEQLPRQRLIPVSPVNQMSQVNPAT